MIRPFTRYALALSLGVASLAGSAPAAAADVPAYYMAEFDLKDAKTFEPYHQGTPKTVEQYGGIYLVRGGQTTSLEGQPPKRIIIMRFANMAAAQRWYNSPEYSALRPHRQRSGDTRNFFVEGFLDKLPD